MKKQTLERILSWFDYKQFRRYQNWHQSWRELKPCKSTDKKIWTYDFFFKMRPLFKWENKRKIYRFEKLAMRNNVTKNKNQNYTAKNSIQNLDDFSSSLFLLLLLIIGLQASATHTVRYTGSVSYFLRSLGCFPYTLCSFIFYFLYHCFPTLKGLNGVYNLQ